MPVSPLELAPPGVGKDNVKDPPPPSHCTVSPSSPFSVALVPRKPNLGN